MDPRDFEKQIERLARAGYAARGIVYLLVGGIAVSAGWRGAGDTPGSRGALEGLLDEPAGEVFLGLIGLGLVGYAVWRLFQATRDTENHGTDLKGLAIRGAMLVSAFVHVGLATFVLSLITGIGGGAASASSQEDWTAWLLARPLGRWLVAAVALAIAGAGIGNLVKAYRASFERHMNLGRHRSWARPLCRFGIACRGVIWLVIASFFATAAWRYDAEQAGGLSEALRTLQQQTYGPYLLMVVGLGLAAFGVFSFLEAAYRRVEPGSLSRSSSSAYLSPQVASRRRPT